MGRSGSGSRYAQVLLKDEARGKHDRVLRGQAVPVQGGPIKKHRLGIWFSHLHGQEHQNHDEPGHSPHQNFTSLEESQPTAHRYIPAPGVYLSLSRSALRTVQAGASGKSLLCQLARDWGT